MGLCGPAEAMINTKRALLILPFFVAAMLATDLIFDSAHLKANRSVPVWMIAGFIASALAVVAAGIWYLTRHAGGKIPQKREHAYVAVLVGVMVSGFVGDALGGIAALFLGGKSVWVMIPSYALAYVVLLWTIAFAMKVLDGNDHDGAAQRSGNSPDGS
jgi:hypothetical protein